MWGTFHALHSGLGSVDWEEAWGRHRAAPAENIAGMCVGMEVPAASFPLVPAGVWHSGMGAWLEAWQ